MLFSVKSSSLKENVFEARITNNSKRDHQTLLPQFIFELGTIIIIVQCVGNVRVSEFDFSVWRRRW